MNDRVWCFWEPKANIHGYLELCLKTWDSLDREIVILDDSNLSQYLSERELKLLKDNKNFYSLPQYADAVRVMILHRYGGIWMDLDTIILSPQKFKEVERLKAKTELIMVDKHIGWIWASKGSTIVAQWYKELLKKLDFNKYKIRHHGIAKRILFAIRFVKYTIFNESEKIRNLSNYIEDSSIEWDYLGNSIVNKLIEDTDAQKYVSLTTIFPYETFMPESVYWGEDSESIDKPKNYQKFYFDKIDTKNDFTNSVFICLHNSWTPEQYKKMNAADFLESGIALAKLLQYALHNKS